MKKGRVFIIHGWEGHPQEGWLLWLRKELEEKGFEVIAPEMPDTKNPRIDEWVTHLASLAVDMDQDTHFVGHSIGCQAIMRFLEIFEGEKIGKVIFVAGWFNLQNLSGKGEEEIAKPWLEIPIDLIRVVRDAKSFTAIFSDNDPYVPLADKNIFKKELEAKIIIEKGKGHFTEEDGVTELPVVLEEIIS